METVPYLVLPHSGSLSVDDIETTLTNQGFHAHTGGIRSGQPWQDHLAKSAKQEANDRLASRCASWKATEKAVAEFIFEQQQGTMMAVTNHSRNGDSIFSAFDCHQAMFKDTLRYRPQDWPLYGVTYQGHYADMPMEQMARLFGAIAQSAADLIGYGDGDLVDNWDREELIRQQYPDKWVVSGLEVNLTASGGIDTVLARSKRCQIFVLALHPRYDPHGFGQLKQDPLAYSQFIAQAILQHQPHIIAHLGYGCALPGDTGPDAEQRFRAQMDWSPIGQACLEANTLIECNYSRIYSAVSKAGVAPNTSSADKFMHQLQLEQLYSMTPIINDDSVMEQLAPALNNGLGFALDSDRHGLPEGQAAIAAYNRHKTLYARYLAPYLNKWQVNLANCWSLAEQQQFFTARL